MSETLEGTSKAETKQADPGPGAADTLTAEQQFLELLNNRAKNESFRDGSPRTGGFLCIVRGPDGNRIALRRLQALCHSDQQSWNWCFTLRYRVESRDGLGTFLHSLVRDLRLMIDAASDWSLLSATPQPETREAIPDRAGGEGHSWQELLDRALDLGMDRELPPLERPSGEPLPTLDEEWVGRLLAVLGEEKLLGSGDRLVLFCEFGGDDDPGVWEGALPFILERLHERVGLVLSGAPVGFTPPDDPVHVREITLSDDESQPQGERTQHFQIAGLRSDRPATEDALSVTRYAGSLAQFVLHPDTDALTIGVHGPWGKGKSSFMGFIEHHLVIEASRRLGLECLAAYTKAADDWLEARETLERAQDRGRRKGSLRPGSLEQLGADLARCERVRDAHWATLSKATERDVICVPFNAWRFQDSKQIWAGLASVIIERLESSLSAWQKLRLRLGYVWRARRADAFRTIAELALALAVGGLLAYWVGPSVETGLALESLAGDGAVSSLVTVFGGSVAVVLLAAWRINSLIRPLGERILEYARLPNYRDQMGFQHQVLNDIQSVAANVRRCKKAEPRIVVFIDDLDRCSDDKIMEILQAINLVLGASSFYVVLGVDTEMLYRAIEAHYQEAHSLGKGAEAFSRRYLRKIIQLSFHLPDTGETDRLEFIRHLFSRGARMPESTEDDPRRTEALPPGEADAGDLPLLPVDPAGPDNPDPVPVEQVTDSAHELQAFLDYSGFIEDNARETKRLVNVHRLVKIMLQQNEGWTADRQRRLVRWLIFCTRWPELIDDALRYAEDHPDDPNLLANGKLPGRDRDFERFAGLTSDPIPAEALARDRALALAAKVAELVRDRPEVTSTGGVPDPDGAEARDV